MTEPFRIVMAAFPRMTQLDLTGPFEVFARLPGAQVEIAWKSAKKPVVDAAGLALMPTAAFRDVARCDLLFIPGGPGQLDLMEDEETLDFLRRMAATARYVTSVCTGSLVLGAAGLLKGYRATCHWLSMPQLAFLGAVPVEKRVVIDRNRFTGAGVSSGIDLAFAVARDVAGEEEARRIALAIEYQPEPVFPARDAEDQSLVAEVRAKTAGFQEKREAVARRAGLRLGIAPGPSAAPADSAGSTDRLPMHQGTTMKLYRYLTGPDDSAFCKRVSAALNTGWQLHGAPTLTFDPVQGRVICGQAIVKEVPGAWSDEVNLSDH